MEVFSKEHEYSARLRVYYHPASDASRKVLLTAAHLGIDVDLRIVDAKRLAHRTADYLKINPNGLFPVLIEDDFVLWESTAIMQYLAEKKPETSLWPGDARLRADITRWQCWDLAHWGPALRPLMVERVGKKLKGLGEPDEAKIEEATATLMRVASVLDHHLQDREWLVSQVVTLADLSVASHFMYRDLAKFPFDRFAGINDWFARIEVLHCWRRTRPSIPGVL